MGTQNVENRTSLIEAAGVLSNVSEKSGEVHDASRRRASRQQKTMPKDVEAASASLEGHFRPSDFARWLVAGLMLAYGIITFNRGAPTWAIASLVLFAAPLALGYGSHLCPLVRGVLGASGAPHPVAAWGFHYTAAADEQHDRRAGSRSAGHATRYSPRHYRRKRLPCESTRRLPGEACLAHLRDWRFHDGGHPS